MIKLDFEIFKKLELVLHHKSNNLGEESFVIYNKFIFCIIYTIKNPLIFQLEGFKLYY